MMRFSAAFLLTTLILSGTVVIGPAAALGVSFEFPTLTWPVATPAPTPAQPAVDCADPATADAGAALCPAPSR